ncbi:MAG: hypothetical protein IJ555_08050 [Ruminococcus sp.]|nr:hypothetical protein [Ruminococcus sp.]MBR1739058.1 hypothetical protein [Ruminococcus sp.]
MGLMTFSLIFTLLVCIGFFILSIKLMKTVGALKLENMRLKQSCILNVIDSRKHMGLHTDLDGQLEQCS